jgi:hypothetical protein
VELAFTNLAALGGSRPGASRRPLRRMARAYGQVVDLRYVSPSADAAPDPMSYDRGGHPAPWHSKPGGILDAKA